MNQSIGLEFLRLLGHGWSAEEMTSPGALCPPAFFGGVIAAPAYLNAVSQCPLPPPPHASSGGL